MERLGMAALAPRRRRPGRRNGGRPKTPEADRLTARTTVGFTEQELVELKEKSKALGLRPAALIRHVVTKRPLPTAPTPVLDHSARVQLARLTEHLRIATLRISGYPAALQMLVQKVLAHGRDEHILVAQLERYAGTAELTCARILNAEEACSRLAREIEQGRSGLPPDAANELQTRVDVAQEAGALLDKRLARVEKKLQLNSSADS